MFLTYNGIELSIEHVISYEQTPVYDPSGVDYLYTHHRIVVRAVWNPAATSDVSFNTAATAIAALRATLLQPRKLLTFSVPNALNPAGGAPQNIITSPWRNPLGTRYPCDANNGPKPIGEPIITLVGMKTAIVDFAIETWINECSTNTPILSHRWEMSHEIDQDFYTTRTVTGTAIFRTDWLNARVNAAGNFFQAYPDDFRLWLVHPIPNNFQRKRISVQSSSDGTSLRYTFVDMEQPANIASRFQKISRIEGVTSTFTGKGSWSVMDSANAAAAGATRGGVIGGVVGAAFGGWTFPSLRGVVNIRMWGRRTATLQDLGNAMAAILVNLKLADQLLFGTIQLPAFFFQTSNVTFDMFNRYAEVVIVVDTSTAKAAFFRILGIGPFSFNGDPTTMKPVTSTVASQTSNPIRGGSSGDWIQRLVIQALSTPCTPPAIPPDQTSIVTNLPFYTILE